MFFSSSKRASASSQTTKTSAEKNLTSSRVDFEPDTPTDKETDSRHEEELAASRNGKVHPDGKIELLVSDWEDELGYGWSSFKKWTILTVIFLVQMSMNFNASVYGNAVSLLSKKYNVSNEKARLGQLAFLIAYAFGCELWAPWSEEYGRWIVLQLSLFFVNVWQFPCMFAPNFNTVLAGRILGGLSSAGGSVTLGMVADMWHAENQQYAVAWVVLSSVGGSVFGPVVGGFLEQYLPLRYNFIFQLGIGVAVQFIHFFTPETRSDVLLDRIAKRMRTVEGWTNIYGPTEVKTNRVTLKEVLKIWYRPFKMFATEPIVLCLSLLSGFSDALIFTFIEAYGPVYKQWGFGPVQMGLAFITIGIGYLIAWLSFLPVIRRDIATIRRGDPYPAERRLWWLLFTAPLLPAGIIAFAWCSLGPSHGVPWIAPMIASLGIGIANYAIYMATIDYMIASYAEYSASATGGNGFARDFLAGICVLYTQKLYTNVGKGSGKELPYASTILFCIGVVVCVPVYVFYYKGEWFRKRSKFAMDLETEHLKNAERHAQNLEKTRQEV